MVPQSLRELLLKRGDRQRRLAVPELEDAPKRLLLAEVFVVAEQGAVPPSSSGQAPLSRGPSCLGASPSAPGVPDSAADALGVGYNGDVDAVAGVVATWEAKGV